VKTKERVPFRLIHMPCCGQLVCWINPRIPNYCPECGKSVFARLKWNGDLPDATPAWLEMDEIPTMLEGKKDERGG